jgi:hypothetical protein
MTQCRAAQSLASCHVDVAELKSTISMLTQ